MVGLIPSSYITVAWKSPFLGYCLPDCKTNSAFWSCHSSAMLCEVAEAQRRRRSTHLHLKPDDTICDTRAGSARGTGKAARHANCNSFRGGGNISTLLQNSKLISSVALTAFSSAFLAVRGSSRQRQKGSGEAARHPQPH